MGDTKKSRKTYSTPSHPWQKARIEQEIVLVQDYGLGNKKEIWRSTSFLKKIKDRAKYLVAHPHSQTTIESKQLLQKLRKLGLLQQDTDLSAILELTIKDILERRLQTLVYRKGHARTMKQSRQFITHQHIFVHGKKMTVPSYLVSVDEEEAITFDPVSSMADAEHPERTILEKKEQVKKPVERKRRGKREGNRR